MLKKNCDNKEQATQSHQCETYDLLRRSSTQRALLKLPAASRRTRDSLGKGQGVATRVPESWAQLQLRLRCGIGSESLAASGPRPLQLRSAGIRNGRLRG